MQKSFAFLFVFALSLAAGRAQSVNIATWMVELPETNTTNRAAEYAPLLTRVAGVLKPLNADVILLHGIASRTVTRQLADLMRPRIYHNPLLSSFKKNSQSTKLTEPAISMLSRKQATVARTIEWRTVGPWENPGGFSMAVFNYGTNAFYLYIVQFPKAVAGMAPDQEAAIPRQREQAARYVLSHLNWMIETGTNAASIAYLATDIELDSPTTAKDPALAVLTTNGFKPSTGSRTLVASTALSSTGWPPEGALVSAFVRGTEFPGDPESIGAKSFFAPIALVDLDIRPTPRTSPSAPTAPATSPAPVPSPVPPQPAPPSSSVTSLAGTNPVPPISAATTPLKTEPAATPIEPTRLASSPGPAPAAPPADRVPPGRVFSAGTGDEVRWVPWAENRTVVVGVAGAAFLVALAFIARGRRHPETEKRALVSARAERAALPTSDRRMTAAETAASSIHVLENAARVRGSEDHENEEAEEEPPPKSSSLPFFQLLRERMVRWLAAERSQLLSSHHAGAEQVLELEERLTRIQNQFETRLRAREQRISDLEVELMTKEKSISDLEQALTGRDRSN